MGVAIEAGELLKLYLWQPESDQASAEHRQRAGEEMTDVMIFLLNSDGHS